MNRPNIKNYEEWPFEMPYEYHQDLEKYCDQLELTNRLLQEANRELKEKLSYEEVATDNECRAKEIYLKALDLACEELNRKELYIWKEYLLHKAITQEEKR